ncbi:protein UPSTREAM OF FLC isoform X1 [Populus alba x Populus x berolinensis]|uniref:Protein UPSTREAM OF FLC isoform X1 n=1 Tax=Populus alba x Populus x berolinensis TaxID=444605 RepID=A0AAD6W7U9_9ROSI|nr:protein UPSTREAM OF FLC isoform X1 [Populus alba x Populus x berolinensis]
METTRMKKYNRQLSPERAKVWTERSPKYQQQNRKVAVVYYLCRNRQLEHPHFIEVPLASPDGLYLRDVIERLNVLRGRGMASLYSWSSKRSYKNGFVWHDLCEDDLILPAHGNEYVLKGSELFEESNSDHFAPVGTIKMQNLKLLPQPASSRSQDDSSSASSLNGKETKHSQEDEISPRLQHPGSSGVSPESTVGKNSSWNGSLSLTEYKVYKSDGFANASTQTEENGSRPKSRETCTRGVSTDDASLERECKEDCQNRLPCVKENSEICENSVSPPQSSSSPSSSGGKTETLESLIRADVNKINSFRIIEEEDIRMPNNARLKASNMLMQLISCGSISVKDHSFGLVPTYRPRFSHSKFPSPLYSTSVMLGELDSLSENPRVTGLKLEEKEYFSGSLIEMKMLEGGDGLACLKRSSSYNADRMCKQPDSVEDNGESTSGHSKCISQSIKASLSKQPHCISLRSPVSDKPRNSSDGADGSQVIHYSLSNGGSQRITEPVPGKKQSKKLDSFREEERVIKIEERARVIIHSKAPCNPAVCRS